MRDLTPEKGPAGLLVGWPAFAADFVRGLARSIRQSTEIWRRRRVLQQLSDPLLRDIGITRSDIEYIAEASVTGRVDPTRRKRGFR